MAELKLNVNNTQRKFGTYVGSCNPQTEREKEMGLLRFSCKGAKKSSEKKNPAVWQITGSLKC